MLLIVTVTKGRAQERNSRVPDSVFYTPQYPRLRNWSTPSSFDVFPDELFQSMRSRSARSQKVDPHTRSRELTSQSGIITGRLVDWASALETSTAELMDAIDRADVEPLVDTGTYKDGEDHQRPTNPELRCLALTEADVGRVTAELLDIAPLQDAS